MNNKNNPVGQAMNNSMWPGSNFQRPSSSQVMYAAQAQYPSWSQMAPSYRMPYFNMQQRPPYPGMMYFVPPSTSNPPVPAEVPKPPPPAPDDIPLPEGPPPADHSPSPSFFPSPQVQKGFIPFNLSGKKKNKKKKGNNSWQNGVNHVQAQKIPAPQPGVVIPPPSPLPIPQTPESTPSLLPSPSPTAAAVVFPPSLK